MGDVLKSIGSVLSPIASVAGSLIPGIGPAVGAIGSILGAAGPQQHAQSQANAQTAAQQQIANQQQAQYAQYQSQIQPALLQQAGFNASGQYDPNYNPYTSIANTLYNPANLTPQIVAGRESSDASFNNAVAANNADSLGRGFTQNNSATTGDNATLRQTQAENNAAYARDLASQQLQQKNGLLVQGLGVKNNTLGSLASTTSNSAQGALGTIGGLQGLYQGQANAYGQGINNAVGGLSTTGLSGLGTTLGGILGMNKKRTTAQSQTIGTTNAQPPSATIDDQGDPTTYSN